MHPLQNGKWGVEVSWAGPFHTAIRLLMTCAISVMQKEPSLERTSAVNPHLACRIWLGLFGSGQQPRSMPMFCVQILPDVLKELQGGSWFVDASKGTCRPSDGYPLSKATSARYPDVGFRCCRGAMTTSEPTPLKR